MAAVVVRLRRRLQFLKVAGSGRKWVAPGLVLQARAWHRGEVHGDAPLIRVGFTVSRKVGGAVERNRARRRLRAAADAVLPEHAVDAHDFVLIGRAATLNRPFQALVDDLKTGLKRLHAYRGAGAADGSEARPCGADARAGRRGEDR